MEQTVGNRYFTRPVIAITSVLQFVTIYKNIRVDQIFESEV